VKASPVGVGVVPTTSIEPRLWNLITAVGSRFPTRDSALLTRLVHLRRYDEALLNLTWLIVEHDVKIARELMTEIRSVSVGIVDPDDFPYAFESQLEVGELVPAQRPVIGHAVVRSPIARPGSRN
jgi:hypothetical protein